MNSIIEAQLELERWVVNDKVFYKIMKKDYVKGNLKLQ